MKRSDLQRGGAWRGALLPLTLIFLASAPAHAADRIILRNTDILTDRSVTAFDEDGVQLDDGSLLGWDEIDRARIAEQQARFDRLLAELGGPLFRLRTRLQVGDYKDLLAEAEALYPRYQSRRSRAAYMVLQALMWGRLAAGQREEALMPYLRCYDLLRDTQQPGQLPGSRRLKFDPQTGLSPELIPLWFDVDAARAALPNVQQTIAGMSRPLPPGALIYYAALALAAGEQQAAERVLAIVESNHPSIVQLQQILAAQREVEAGRHGQAVAQLAAGFDRLSETNKPLALYWLGMSQLGGAAATSPSAGMLDLLRIPAVYGDQYPELSAAALFQTMRALNASGDALGSVAVRNELLIRYGQTYFAERLKSRGPDQRD